MGNQVLLEVINKAWMQEGIPSDWKTAKILPIFVYIYKMRPKRIVTTTEV